jgi:predicted amidohydrolase YtcJ
MRLAKCCKSLTFAAAIAMVAAAALASETADVVVINATVVTVDPAQPAAEAFAMVGDKFAAVGTNDQVLQLRGEQTKVIDMAGKTILPGFIDAHIHPSPLYDEFDRLGQVDCSPKGVASKDELIDRLKQKAAATPPGQWVLGSRYQDTKLGGHLTRLDLDRVSRNHPVYVSHSSGHVGACNSYALQLAGVTAATPDPAGGRFDRDPTGEPNGVLRESAKSIVRDAGPETPTATDREWLAGIHRQFDAYLACGITGVQHAGTSPATVRKYAQAIAEQPQIRIYVMLSRRYLDNWQQGKVLAPQQTDWLKLGAIKHFHGNSLSGQTCWLSKPYVDRPDYFGIPPADSQSTLDRKVREIHQAGLQACIHANGDREIAMVLDAYERALVELPRDDHRHRIEHGSVMTPELLDRIKQLGVVLAPHSYVWEHGDKMEVYGPERWEWMHVNGSATRLGVPVAGNSDSPVSEARPLLRIQSMVTRTSAEGKVYGASQRVSVDDAIRIWTLGSAYASFDEHRKGSITPGKLADFVVLGSDPRRVPTDKIKDVPVVATWVGGQQRWPQE